MYDNEFVRGVNEMEKKSALEILNWYRNLYYNKDEYSERGIMVKAIDELINEINDFKLLDSFKYVEDIKLESKSEYDNFMNVYR